MFEKRTNDRRTGPVTRADVWQPIAIDRETERDGSHPRSDNTVHLSKRGRHRGKKPPRPGANGVRPSRRIYFTTAEAIVNTQLPISPGFPSSMQATQRDRPRQADNFGRC
jgi:hypothetical protein